MEKEKFIELLSYLNKHTFLIASLKDQQSKKLFYFANDEFNNINNVLEKINLKLVRETTNEESLYYLSIIDSELPSFSNKKLSTMDTCILLAIRCSINNPIDQSSNFVCSLYWDNIFDTLNYCGINYGKRLPKCLQSLKHLRNQNLIYFDDISKLDETTKIYVRPTIYYFFNLSKINDVDNYIETLKKFNIDESKSFETTEDVANEIEGEENENQ